MGTYKILVDLNLIWGCTTKNYQEIVFVETEIFLFLEPCQSQIIVFRPMLKQSMSILYEEITLS